MIDRFLCRQIMHVLTPDRDLYFPYGRRSFLQGVLRWHDEATRHEQYHMPADAERFTVILQSYKRPWNMAPLVQMFLRFPNVERVIVSNNNPDAALRLPFTDNRLQIINQPHQYPASKFAVIALQEAEKTASHFLCVDDDLFLFPNQIALLMQSLIDDSSEPHGVAGQILAEDGHVLAHHLTGESAVDVLNRAYAFSAQHIRQYANILDRLGYKTDEEKAQLPFGSDIILSSSGIHKPQIHDVGLLLSCPTAAKKGIARFKDEGFELFRSNLWKRLHALN